MHALMKCGSPLISVFVDAYILYGIGGFHGGADTDRSLTFRAVVSDERGPDKRLGTARPTGN